MRLKGWWLAVVAMMWGAQAWADNYYLNISNQTGYDIYFVYVSPQDSDNWEEDVLDDDEILSDGEEVRVSLKGYSSPMFDVRLVDEDGDSYTFWGINVARQDLTVTLDNLD